MKEWYFNKRIGLTEEDISDILCACIEGGSNYWCQIQNYGKEWDSVEKTLPKGHTIEDHIMALWQHGYSLSVLDMEEDEIYDVSFEDFIQGIQCVIDDGTWETDDIYDVDGCVGDCIMQYAVFGEVIYG